MDFRWHEPWPLFSRELPSYLDAAHGGYGSKTALTTAGRSRLFQRNLDPAIHAFFYEREIDPATELVRSEIAYEIGAVAGLNLGRYRRTSKLAPFQHQDCLLPVWLTVPADRYLAAG